MATQATYHVLELTFHSQATPSTVYPVLLSCGSELILIDTGYPGQMDALAEAFSLHGYTLAHLNHILMTHHDIDHIGNLKALRSLDNGQGITVWAHETEAPYIDGRQTPVKITMFEPKLDQLPPAMREMILKMKLVFSASFAPVDQLFKDGQRLPWGDIEVIHTPGHTPGHICLYIPESKTLIAGDLLIVKDGQLDLLEDHIQYQLSLCQDSLQKLTAYDIETVICYHGGVYQTKINEGIKDLIQTRFSAELQ